MMRLRFPYQVEVPHVGILALVGVTDDFLVNPLPKETVVQFILEYDQFNAPLLGYLWTRSAETQELIGTLWQIKPMMLAADADRRLLFFTRNVQGKLKNYWKFLHSTSMKLMRELLVVQQNESQKQKTSA